MGQCGPTEFVTRKTVCDGCSMLKTEYWKDYLDNDETDSGTSARCLAANRTITAYWYKNSATPEWWNSLRSMLRG